MVRDTADKLRLDQSNVSRRLRMAAKGGYLRNLDDKRGKPGRWVIGDPLPESIDLLQQRSSGKPLMRAIAATHRKRATPLVELGEVAAFVACDRAAAMTGTVANLTGGEIVD